MFQNLVYGNKTNRNVMKWGGGGDPGSVLLFISKTVIIPLIFQNTEDQDIGNNHFVTYFRSI